LEVNPSTGKVSLVGIFQALHFQSFRSAQKSFTVYFALYDGLGEGIIELTISQLETERDVFYRRRHIVFPGRGMVMNIDFPVVNCRFPAPGNYAISLRLKGKEQDSIRELAYRFLDVFRIEVQP